MWHDPAEFSGHGKSRGLADYAQPRIDFWRAAACSAAAGPYRAAETGRAPERRLADAVLIGCSRCGGSRPIRVTVPRADHDAGTLCARSANVNSTAQSGALVVPAVGTARLLSGHKRRARATRLSP